MKLKPKEVVFLKKFTSTGKRSAREIKRAYILLLLHDGEKILSIADKLHVHRGTVYNIKKSYLQEGLENALSEKPRSGQPRKYTDKQEAEIIAAACTDPPEGRKRWTVRLLAEEMSKKKDFKIVNREKVRLVLKKVKRNLG